MDSITQIALGAAVGEADVPAPARDPEGGVGVGDADVREAGPLEPAGVGGAVDRRDDRLVDVRPSGRTQAARRCSISASETSR